METLQDNDCGIFTMNSGNEIFFGGLENEYVEVIFGTINAGR